jgi:hypothetical protein
MSELQKMARWYKNRAADSMPVASAQWELPVPNAGPEHIASRCPLAVHSTQPEVIF